MKKKIRLGVIGTGLVFQNFHLPSLKELSDSYDIVALCNRTVGKAEQIGRDLETSPRIFADHNALLAQSDIDAVLVSVPIHLLAEITQDAIRQNKHVFQEKPIADKLGDGEKSLALAQKHNVTLMVGENFRYRPEFRQVHRLVQDGLIGKPKLYRLNDLHYTYPGGLWSQTLWRHEGKHDGGYLIDGGTHIIAGMREMVRSKIKFVHGLSLSFYPELLSNQDDSLLLHLVFENGMVGQMALGYGTIDRDARKPKVYGDKGTLVLLPKQKRIEFWPVGKDAETEEFAMDSIDNDFREQWVDFYASVVEGKTPYSTPEDALMDLRIIQAGRHSSATGKTVTLET